MSANELGWSYYYEYHELEPKALQPIRFNQIPKVYLLAVLRAAQSQHMAVVRAGLLQRRKNLRRKK